MYNAAHSLSSLRAPLFLSVILIFIPQSIALLSINSIVPRGWPVAIKFVNWLIPAANFVFIVTTAFSQYKIQTVKRKNPMTTGILKGITLGISAFATILALVTCFYAMIWSELMFVSTFALSSAVWLSVLYLIALTLFTSSMVYKETLVLKKSSP